MAGRPIPTAGADDAVFLAHLADLAEKSEWETAVSSFLTGRECRLAAAEAAREKYAGRLFFWGGCRGAMRRAAVILPPWVDLSALPRDAEKIAAPLSLPPDPLAPEREDVLLAAMREELDGGAVREKIAAVRVSGSGYKTLTHRDFFGAVMATGVRRDAIGEVAVLSPREAVVFAERRVASYLTETLTAVGADTVRATLFEVPEDFSVPRRFEPVTGTVQSARLDGVVHALCDLSREKAAALVSHGDVVLNDFPAAAGDAPVEPGDVIAVRGFGKFIIDGVSDVTKKGRIRLAARKFS